MQTLKELQLKNQYSTDKESTHHYLDIYDKLFAPFKDKVINLFECGFATGGSADLWRDYFINADSYFIDIDDTYFPKWNLYSRVYTWRRNINELTKDDFLIYFDIAIDDGSHFVKDQLAFFNLLWPLMNTGGLLIIEDIDNIDSDKHFFDELNIPYEIIDLRKETDRYDSVLLIFIK